MKQNRSQAFLWICIWRIKDISAFKELIELGILLQNVLFDDYFIEQTFDANGNLLMPHEIIFCPTLEVVKINGRNLMEFVCEKITFD